MDLTSAILVETLGNLNNYIALLKRDYHPTLLNIEPIEEPAHSEAFDNQKAIFTNELNKLIKTVKEFEHLCLSTVAELNGRLDRLFERLK